MSDLGKVLQIMGDRYRLEEEVAKLVDEHGAGAVIDAAQKRARQISEQRREEFEKKFQRTTAET